MHKLKIAIRQHQTELMTADHVASHYRWEGDHERKTMAL